MVGGLDAPLLMHLAEEDEFISKAAQAEIKTALAGKSNATSTAIRVSITRSLGTMGRITMPRRRRLPTAGQANFYINNYGNLRSLQQLRSTGVPSARICLCLPG
jgi:hypothetical protein